MAVLDWELAHIGDPMEDLGWICVNPWRFGMVDKPVGGFGRRDDLYAGYEAAGGVPVGRAHVRFWEVFGTLKWGECRHDGSVPAGGDRPPRLETEADLMRMLLEAASTRCRTSRAPPRSSPPSPVS